MLADQVHFAKIFLLKISDNLFVFHLLSYFFQYINQIVPALFVPAWPDTGFAESACFCIAGDFFNSFKIIYSDDIFYCSERDPCTFTDNVCLLKGIQVHPFVDRSRFFYNVIGHHTAVHLLWRDSRFIFIIPQGFFNINICQFQGFIHSTAYAHFGHYITGCYGGTASEGFEFSQ